MNFMIQISKEKKYTDIILEVSIDYVTPYEEYEDDEDDIAALSWHGPTSEPTVAVLEGAECKLSASGIEPNPARPSPDRVRWSSGR